jgi:hypothetical protein
MNLDQAIIEATRAYHKAQPNGRNYQNWLDTRQSLVHRVVVKLGGEGFVVLPVCKSNESGWRDQLIQRAAQFLVRNPRFQQDFAEIVGDDLIFDVSYREVGA